VTITTTPHRQSPTGHPPTVPRFGAGSGSRVGAVRRLLAVAVAALAPLAAGACTVTGDQVGMRVGVAYNTGQPDDTFLNDATKFGLTQAQKAHPGKITQFREMTAKVGEADEDKYDRLIILCESGYNPVLAVGYGYTGADPAGGPLAKAAKACPQTHFIAVDDPRVRAGNVANLVFAEEQGAFLAGVTAALSTKTGKVAFIGGCQISVVTAVEAGFRAGVAAVRPDVNVQAWYLSTDPAQCTGFSDPDGGRIVANNFYSAGVDVIFHAAGGASLGIFQSAKVHGGMAIGFGADQYLKVTSDLHAAILTSIKIRVDVAVENIMDKFLQDGTFVGGQTRYDLASGQVGYTTSGGHITDIKSVIESYRQKIVSGQIVVPTSLP
jgi:basic membrane protein A